MKSNNKINIPWRGTLILLAILVLAVGYLNYAKAVVVSTPCTADMVPVGASCVDKYEASVWSDPNGLGIQFGVFTGQTAYPLTFPPNGNWTVPLYAVSKAGILPSTGLTWFQAQQACALSGKSLIPYDEWLMAAAGTPDPGRDNLTTDCNINSGVAVPSRSRTDCVSNWGVHDTMGNVMEWTTDWVQGTGTNSTWLPTGSGLPGALPQNMTSLVYGQDFMRHVNPANVQATPVQDLQGTTQFPAVLIPGGFFGGGMVLPGVFALRADFAPSVQDVRVGFRCAR